jgi:hypothetical protein
MVAAFDGKSLRKQGILPHVGWFVSSISRSCHDGSLLFDGSLYELFAACFLISKDTCLDNKAKQQLLCGIIHYPILLIANK